MTDEKEAADDVRDPKRKRFKICGECPFINDYIGAGPRLVLECTLVSSVLPAGSGQSTPPEWCPLRTRPVLVELDVS